MLSDVQFAVRLVNTFEFHSCLFRGEVVFSLQSPSTYHKHTSQAGHGELGCSKVSSDQVISLSDLRWNKPFLTSCQRIKWV